MPEWVLGLDGGGTKTILALANQNGEVLGPFIGAGVNPFDQPNWKNELEVLLAHCPIKREEIAFSSFGLPGYGESASINAQQLEVVKNLAGQNAVALNDVAVAFGRGPFGGDGLGDLLRLLAGSLRHGQDAVSLKLAEVRAIRTAHVRVLGIEAELGEHSCVRRGECAGEVFHDLCGMGFVTIHVKV